MGILPIIINWVVHLSMINAMHSLICTLFSLYFTKVDLMVDFIIIVVPIGIPTGSWLIPTVIITASIPIATPILPFSPLIRRIKFSTWCYFRTSRHPLALVVPTIMCLMGFTTNLTRNIWFLINLISVIMRNLTLSLTMPFCDASGNSTPCISEQIRLMG